MYSSVLFLWGNYTAPIHIYIKRNIYNATHGGRTRFIQAWQHHSGDTHRVSSHQLVLAQLLRLEGLALPLRVARRVPQATIHVAHAQQRHGVRGADRQQKVDEEACK